MEESSSTNDVASSLAGEGARHGFVVVSEKQTKGRGRHGRAWISPEGGLTFTTSVQPVTGTAVANEKSRPEQFSGEIQALMPGRISGILVKAGELVEAGTPLLILEAMKMQNEITSPMAGRIATILVHEGESVKRGSVLLVLDNLAETAHVQ